MSMFEVFFNKLVEADTDSGECRRSSVGMSSELRVALGKSRLGHKNARDEVTQSSRENKRALKSWGEAVDASS